MQVTTSPEKRQTQLNVEDDGPEMLREYISVVAFLAMLSPFVIALGESLFLDQKGDVWLYQWCQNAIELLCNQYSLDKPLKD